MPDFLSPAQCRMARALLNWTQPTLAERCGLAPMTISKFEKEEGRYNPEARTLRKIMSVFEVAGVAFTQSGGVEPVDNLVTILEGDDANFRLLDDIYNTLKDTGGEVLIAGLREVSKSEERAYEFLSEHLQRLIAADISERILLEEGDENLVAPAEWYRYLPKGRFTDSPFQLYGANLALIQWGPPQHIVLIKHKIFAQTFRNLFDIIWEQATPVSTGK
ncbi:MAG: XRE family transcriptional regulator [Alphaproteobacteria bacterium]|nr:XRE family transcriptional regulator [Alphaproteobacteria bacterium]